MAWMPDYITDAELSAYTRIGDDLDDAEIADAITGASRAVDGYCNRQFGNTGGAEQRLYTAVVRGCRWVIDIDDLMTAAGLVVVITNVGTLTAYDKVPINASLTGKPWTRLVVQPDSTVRPTGKAYEVAITANPWGWSSIPKPVKLTTKLQASRFLSRRESPYGVAGSPEQGSEMRLLSRVDPDLGVALGWGGFVRPRRVG